MGGGGHRASGWQLAQGFGCCSLLKKAYPVSLDINGWV